ncbi:hypothetical protein WJX81_001064 [Elliptochloris bilobata]|uniref:Large ribosomal subunit protein mL53 n=1 Tax=Elliptochloris bilobata TaxID=381761 RepID=A0AAW1QUZ2_9CHLO
MSLNLSKITRILINFVPWSGEARCAREFLSRVSGGKAVATNPECDVTVREVVERISVRCEELTTRETLQGVGIGKLNSAWGVEQYDSGKAEIAAPG